ncbi:aminotransferase class I/II-fold pyridoxal phosphate-dependent enzyme [Exiguobacterium acetylicum]|uniref:aminotransferase class I/II-fold pyridoxal phosphate-dependent enzyme n=1 Tax=Exiguobacterium acetylicum TaxID=41170 RepID=UPI0039772F98
MKHELPIVHALQRHLDRTPISWHVPGHKNGTLTSLPDFFKWDVTELPGLDDFHHPEEAIADAIALLRQIYNAQASHFLVNGSTVGNWAMLAATAARGERVYVQRNSHKSVFNALEWLGIEPIFLEPDIHEETGISGHVSRETLKEAFTNYPGGVGVFITSPTYYGEVADITSLVQLTASSGIPLLVDEAHGAHFGNSFGVRSAFELGATAVVQSAHKTLPALTMGAWMHERFTENMRRRLKRALQAFQTSSPSYLLLASLDYARFYREQWTVEIMSDIRSSHDAFVQELQRFDHLTVTRFDDWSRMTLTYEGYSGDALLQALRTVQLDAEFALGDHVVCILPLRLLSKSEQDDWINRVERAMQNMKLEGIPSKRYIEQSIMGKIQVSALACSYEQLEQATGTFRHLDECIGHVSLETIIPYPPGIPLIVRGECITAEQVLRLRHYQTVAVHLQGGEQLQHGALRVIEEGFEG